MDTAAHLAAIDRLRARPFPAQRDRSALGESGPGFHVAGLLVSEGFWEADAVRLREVEEDFSAELEVLVRALAGRWGEPRVVPLAGCLERSARGDPVPEPLRSLCALLPRAYGWRVDGRWVGVGVGQGGREFPLQLIVGIGEGDVGEPDTAAEAEEGARRACDGD